MEWALHVNGVQEVEGIQTGPLDPVQVESRKVIEEAFGRIAFSRVYFGNEFCQHLIPTLAHLRAVYLAAVEKGFTFTLLTPYITDDGLEKLKPLLSFLSTREDLIEVVVNDWGVFNFLRR
ncbi:MAG: hypothetical protein ACK4Z6_06630, partial [Candidatus Methylomirabilales bacterium]